MTVQADLLKREECLLLVVDVQRTMLDPCKNARRLLKNTAALIEIFKIVGAPVLFSEHNKEKLGPVVPELLSAAPGSRSLNKQHFSCLQDPELRQAIESYNRKSLVLCGLETHVCIFQTAADALNSGFRVHVVADAVGSRSLFNWKIGLLRLKMAGAVISSTEMTLFELLNQAGTPEFRQALPIIKQMADASK